MLWILLSLLPAGPGPLVDECDLVELNHYYDCTGRLVFDQVIWSDWSPADSRWQVIAWRLTKDDLGLTPHRDSRCGAFVSRWWEVGVCREVRASCFRETWTQFDPELAERDALPQDRRRGLARDKPAAH